MVYVSACRLFSQCILYTLIIRSFRCLLLYFPHCLSYEANLVNPFLCPCRQQRTNKMNFDKCVYINGFLKLDHICCASLCTCLSYAQLLCSLIFKRGTFSHHISVNCHQCTLREWLYMYHTWKVTKWTQVDSAQ